MSDEHLQSAIDRLDTALARIETALARPRAAAVLQSSPDTAAFAVLEQRHGALRQVLSDSVHELDTLLAVAEAAPTADAPSAESGR